MTYGETTIGQTIARLLSEHPDLDASARLQSTRTLKTWPVMVSVQRRAADC